MGDPAASGSVGWLVGRGRDPAEDRRGGMRVLGRAADALTKLGVGFGSLGCCKDMSGRPAQPRTSGSEAVYTSRSGPPKYDRRRRNEHR